VAKRGTRRRAEARRFARAFDYDERGSTGKRAPLFGLLPLRLWRSMADRMRRDEDGGR
jgi:hypothetical protein